MAKRGRDATAAGGAAAGAGDGSAAGAGAAAFTVVPVLPGQEMTAHFTVAPKTRLGSGLLPDGPRVVSTVSGRLQHKPPHKYWVEASAKRYTPVVGDTVIGVVTDHMSDAYRVDLHATSSALLPVLAFEGASKRNKPNLAVGTLVFARVAVSDRDLEPELSCQVAGGPKKDWVTGECVFGELKDGNVVQCSLGLARRLLNPNCTVLQALAAHLPFEVAVGCNGRVWVHSGSVKHTVVIGNALVASEHLDDAACKSMVRKLLAAIE